MNRWFRCSHSRDAITGGGGGEEGGTVAIPLESNGVGTAGLRIESEPNAVEPKG